MFCSVNPIIYAYSSREFRRAFVKYLCQCFPRCLRHYLLSHDHFQHWHYRRRPSSLISTENVESNSDNNNRQTAMPSTSTMPTAIVMNIHNKKPTKIVRLAKQQVHKAIIIETIKNPLFLDYCTYHDVAVSRVTCL
jgi:hypothetical protein